MDKEDKRRIIDKLATSLAGDIEVLADEHQMTCYGLFQEIWSELGDEVLNWCEQLDTRSS